MTAQFDRQRQFLLRRRAVALACFKDPSVTAVTVSGQHFTRQLMPTQELSI